MIEKTSCRTPTPGKSGETRIPTWKFELLRRHILDVTRDSGAEGVAFSELHKLVGARLREDERAALGSLGWHVTTVKLEMEVAGDIARVKGVTPQRLKLI